MTKDAIETASLWGDLPEMLVCPGCRGPLVLDTTAYACPACSEKYPIIRSVPRFVASQCYVGNFGFEWSRHAQTQLDRDGNRLSEEFFRSRLGIEPEDVRGKLVLDGGCGMGRYADVASRYGARVIAVDLSRAVDSARENIGNRENVKIFQADLFRLPFAEETFDFIYSIGVLHHTPNCEAAFRSLVRLLKPGGKIVIWLYSGYNSLSYKMSDLYRKVTPRLPNRLLHALCYVAVPLYHVDRALFRLRLRPVAQALRILLPVSHDPLPEWRVLDTFDWYSPRYQSKHTYEEVFRWFESERLIHNRVLGSPIGVSGQKPPLC